MAHGPRVTKSASGELQATFTVQLNLRARVGIWALHVAVFLSACGLQPVAAWIADRVERDLNRHAWWSAF